MSEIIELKIVIVGSSRVGKTSILNRYLNNTFQENFLSTIGLDKRQRHYSFKDNEVNIQYIDTAGQEKFRALTSTYLKKADGVILVFDIAEKETFYLINQLIEEIDKNNIILNLGLVLLGNKLDLNDKRAVNKEEGQKLASNLNCKYIEVSAKTGEKIDEAFDEISTETYQKYKKSGKRNTSFFLKNSKKQNKHKTKDKKKEIDCCASDV
jgi:small GTP-binding protein